MLQGRPLAELDPQDLAKCQDDIAALALREFQKQRAQAAGGAKSSAAVAQPGSAPPGWSAPGMLSTGAGFGPGGLGGPAGGLPTEPYKAKQLQQPGLTTEELMEKFNEQREKERLAPMDGKEWRMRQEKGLRPELANANVQKPTVGELMAQCQPLSRQVAGDEPAQQGREAEATLSQDEQLRQEALKDLERSQMPAVAAADGDGRLIKTIEHYTFADSEEWATFYVHFDKDLWDGASKHVNESQVKVDSRPSSLEICLQGVPVSDRALQTLADWRLALSPLFGRVEPLMTTHKMRNGKLSVKLAKTKTTPWKKGVKYS